MTSAKQARPAEFGGVSLGVLVGWMVVEPATSRVQSSFQPALGEATSLALSLLRTPSHALALQSRALLHLYCE